MRTIGFLSESRSRILADPSEEPSFTTIISFLNPIFDRLTELIFFRSFGKYLASLYEGIIIPTLYFFLLLLYRAQMFLQPLLMSPNTM